MIINHNMSAMNAHRNMTSNTNAANKSMEKLSSGLRINRAGDDAAGLAISEKMRGQIRGLDQASRNAQDGISMVQTAEGALNETTNILQRMRELSVQSSSDTNTDDDRMEIQKEITQLTEEIDRISENTEFNTKKLLNGELSGNSINGTGEAVGTATAGKVESGWIDTGVTLGSTESQKFQVNIDGNILDIDLSAASATSQLGFADAFKTALNTAIETHNTANPNNQIADIKFDIQVRENAGQTEVNFSIESGTTGADSIVEIKALADGTKVEPTTGIASGLIDSANATKGSNGIIAEDIQIVTGDKLQLEVNGHKIDVALTAKTYNKQDDLEGTGSLSETLQTDIQKALDDYKALTGVDFGNVTVEAKDGALVISSDKADTTNIKVKLDDVSNKLGLGGTSTSSEGGITLQIGANKDQNISIQLNDMSAAALKVADADVTTQEGANNAIASFDEAIKSVSAERAKLGAVQNRLEYTTSNLDNTAENLQSAESRIRDVDMAEEMSTYSKNNILQQAAQAMLAQAKSQPEGVLQLLR